ncbi:MAG: FkbM family methyltransferase [Sulfuricella sp.]|nr:FkbM family methyltransferase [Sulfuricella sp.]
MKLTIIKTGLKRLINMAVTFLGKTSIGCYLYGQIINDAMSRSKTIEHQGLKLIFSTPNPLNIFRADTFSTKEPETLEWIDGMAQGSVVWDIGANIGLYSCYAAKRKGCKVFAFEPSVFNLELLARNIFLNKLTELVTIIPLPLSDAMAVNTLNMTATEWGGALSTFGKSYGYDGQPLTKIFEFSTIGISMSEAADLLKISSPDYIKMDVDGIEHLILKGGINILKNVQGVLIEINDEFQQQAEDARNYLAASGLILKEKRRWSGTDNSPFAATYNQIWHRE